MDWETGKPGIPGLKRKLALAVVIILVLGGLVQMVGKRLGYFGDFSGQKSLELTEETDRDQRQSGTDTAGTSNSGTNDSGTVPGGLSNTKQGKQLAVHIVGAVKKPGVYYVAEGTRLHQLVEQAGAAPGAALSYVNLAQPLEDGIQVVIPTQKEVSGLVSSQAGGGVASQSGGVISSQAGARPGVQKAGGSGITASGLINLNTATAEQLETLPGIGSAYSQRILEYRQSHGGFKSVQELQKVSGIGAKRFAQLQDKVTVR